MDRNSVIGILLIFGIVIGYSLWMTPSKEEMEKNRREADSIAAIQYERDSLANVAQMESLKQAAAAAPQAAAQTNDTDEVAAENLQQYGEFAHAANGTDEIIQFESDLLRIQIARKGGRLAQVELKDYQTHDSLPLVLFTEESSRFGLTFVQDTRIINTSDLYFEPFWYGNAAQRKTVSGSDSIEFGMRLYPTLTDGTPNRSRYIEYHYTLKGDDYMMGFDMKVVGMNDMLASNGYLLDLDWYSDLRLQEKRVDRLNGSTVYYKYLNDDVDYLSETKDDDESLNTRVKWISYKQQFFVATLVAGDYFKSAEVRCYTNPEEAETERYLKTMESQIKVPFSNRSNEASMSFYFGPNKYQTLRNYNLELERQIPLGWSFFLLAWINRYAVIPVFNFLESFNLNYGIIILILTVLLKIVLFPIAYKTYVSSAKMRVLRPEVEEINKKFPNQEDAMKKQQATMGLYKKAGVNPMAGCVPMLLQMPILFAMFRFFPASIELRQKSFLWATDLSSYDSILDLPWDIPFYGDHVSLFTLLMTISTIIYTKMNNENMSTGQQMPSMKIMLYMMPIMFLGFFNNYAAGLSYYYMLANVITFAQMYFIRKTVDENKILLRIQENKKKPVKKSAFQKRLEEMAKQKGATPQRRK